MCGRYTLHTPIERLKTRFPIALLPPDSGFGPRYNMAPSQFLPVITNDQPECLQFFRWGLVPPWAKDDSAGFRMINARAETVLQKPTFRDAFRLRRCLVLADGMYEWATRINAKQPYYIHLQDNAPFAMAGIWERYSQPKGGMLHSFSILTTEPNVIVSELHDRMAVILHAADERLWLQGDADEALSLLRPYPAEGMAAHPVSTAVNSPRNEGPFLIERASPLPEQGSLF